MNRIYEKPIWEKTCFNTLSQIGNFNNRTEYALGPNFGSNDVY